MTIIYTRWPKYPHIYAVFVVHRRILYINSAAEHHSIIQLDYMS